MNTQKTYTPPQPWSLIGDTFGGIAVSSLLVCVISGIVLAIPYQVSDPYLSLSQILLSNPSAVIARNLHYWSAQFFLVFTLIHMIDHFRISRERELRIGPWFRLLISVFIVFYALLSGFILKGDADSEQALLIFRSLFESIPLVGELLSQALLGNTESYLLLYVNHISLATIFIILILFEHARVIWGKAITFVIVFLFLLLLALFFQAPLHDNLNPVLKGPWYFLGLQEILHWMSRPGWIWLFIMILFLPLIFLPYIRRSHARYLKLFMLALLVFYAVLTFIAYFFRGEEWRWEWQGDQLETMYNMHPLSDSPFSAELPAELGSYKRTESCMICHEGMTGFSDAHSPEAIGCVSCHMGNPFSPDKDQAHRGMLMVPGNLENASRSCGTAQCHPDISQRIGTGLMATNSGIVAVDRFVFDEAASPDGFYHIMEIGHTPADQHMRNLCSRCHLGNTKHHPAPVDEESRGGGCNACHLIYTPDARRQVNEFYGQLMPDSSLWTAHPSLDLEISNTHCFGCHSRSGRISTSYEGWHETLLKAEDVHPHDSLRILADGRVFRYISPDVHHQAGMDCIDCHDSYELMGDGTLYMHKEEQVMIRCEDCHFHSQPRALFASSLDRETQLIMQMRERMSDTIAFLPLGNTGRAIWNSHLSGQGEAFIFGKRSGNAYPLKGPAEICSRGNAHDALSCESCHTQWVPQCIGCHNEYDPRVPAYDMIEQREETGGWVESVGLYLAGSPALGVVDDGEKQIYTFSPGMVLSIDRRSYVKDENTGEIFKRLYAPVSAHTTATQGRDCRSCHNSSFAIGYGHGTLTYIIEGEKGHWKFAPRFASNVHDGLPEDAWIPFLGEAEEPHSTRSNTRPFTLEEQRSILLVGACLECHHQDSELMLSTLDDFQAVLEKRSAKCILPELP